VAKHNTRYDKTFFKAVSNQYGHLWSASQSCY